MNHWRYPTSYAARMQSHVQARMNKSDDDNDDNGDDGALTAMATAYLDGDGDGGGDGGAKRTTAGGQRQTGATAASVRIQSSVGFCWTRLDDVGFRRILMDSV